MIFGLIIFTSYFGAGKSQQIGFILLFLGLVTLIISYILSFDAVEFVEPIFNSDLFIEALVSGISALAGMIIGMFAILFVLICIALFLIIQWGYNWYTGVWA